MSSDDAPWQNPTDALVIGAGLAGLATALLLKRQGFSVRVVDARTRPGGRVHTIISPNFGHVNLGGEFVAGFHDAARRWCHELGVELQPRDGFSATGAFPRRVIINGRPIEVGMIGRLEQELERAVEMLIKLAGRVDPIRPWLSPSCIRTLDSITVDNWLLEERFSGTFRALFSDLAPESQSMLALLSLVAGAGGSAFFREMEAFAFKEGAGALVKALFRTLGDSVQLGVLVNMITVSDGIVSIGLMRDKQTIHKARTVIVTPPPPCWPQISGMLHEVTTLPPQMVQNRRLSLIVDVKGRRSTSDDFDTLTDGPCRLIWGGGYCGEYGQRKFAKIDILSCPSLANGKTMKSDLVNEAMALCGLNHRRLAAAYEYRWDKSPWSRGTYPVFGVGKLDPAYNLILTGSAPVFFAGDYTIPGYAGYMEGALRSAEMAAENATRYLASVSIQ